MLTLTRHLLRLRRDHPALAAGDYRALDDAPDGCFAFLRETDDPQSGALVALNLTDAPRTLALDGLGGRVLASTHLDREGTLVEGGVLDLRANEGLVMETQRIRPRSDAE